MPPSYGYCFPRWFTTPPKGLCRTDNDCSYNTDPEPCGEMGYFGCNNQNENTAKNSGNLGMCTCMN